MMYGISKIIQGVFLIILFNFKSTVTKNILEMSDSDSGSIPNGVTNDCSVSSFESCLTTIREVAADPNLSFPVTRKELNLACRKLKEGDTCADSHMKNCTNESQKMVFSDIVRGTKNVLEWLCAPGSFQQDYLLHSKCFRNVSMSEHKCLSIIKKVQSIDKDLHLVSDIETELRTFCWSVSRNSSPSYRLIAICLTDSAMKESVDCQIEFVRRDCGQRALLFLDKYLSEISSQLMADHCASYTYSDGCLANSDIPSGSALSTSNQINVHLLIINTMMNFFLLLN